MSIPPCLWRADHLDCMIEDYDWRFAREQSALINAHWAKELARKPRLFNGKVLLCHTARLVEETGKTIFQAAFFATDYKSFLAHKDFTEHTDPVTNCFAMAALRGSDGANLLGEMAAHTAKAGQINFPAGAPDFDEVTQSRVDLQGSIGRELFEETGLAMSEVSAEQGFVLVRQDHQIACLQILTLPHPAPLICAQINESLAADSSNELCRMHVVKGRSDIRPESMPAFICTFLEAQLG